MVLSPCGYTPGGRVDGPDGIPWMDDVQPDNQEGVFWLGDSQADDQDGIL